MIKRFVLLDNENVQPCLLSSDAANDDTTHLISFVGVQQSLPTSVTKAAPALGDRLQCIKGVQAGPNALDFLIAFQMGRLCEQNPTALFQIVSKDAGFDPLISFALQQGIGACRTTDLSAQAAEMMALAEREIKGGQALRESLNVAETEKTDDAPMFAIVPMAMPAGAASGDLRCSQHLFENDRPCD